MTCRRTCWPARKSNSTGRNPSTCRVTLRRANRIRGRWHAAARLINEAERPVILAGHGVLISRAWDELRELAEKAQIPVITTLLGIGALPTDHLLNLGMPGMHGMAYASLAIDRSDLVIALGARFDDRVYRPAVRLCPRRQNHPL